MKKPYSQPRKAHVIGGFVQHATNPGAFVATGPSFSKLESQAQEALEKTQSLLEQHKTDLSDRETEITDLRTRMDKQESDLTRLNELVESLIKKEKGE